MSAIRSLINYLKFYRDEFYDFWEHLTPAQYGMVLIGVFIAGFLLMRSRR